MSYSKTINELVEYLNVCRDAYYNLNRSIITDEQYDNLFDELKKLEEESGIILSNSPTQTVGYSVASEFKKVEHYKPLLSLDKTKSYDEVVKFINNKPVLFMHKLDGLTIQLTYKDGKFVQAETRGDGFIGEDITENAKTFIGIPKQIPVNGTVRITGEAIITYNDFEYINSKLPQGEEYANPRNLASGSVRQLDSKVCSERKVRFIVWNANDLSTDGTMESGLMKANEYGFNIVHFCKVPLDKGNDTSFIESTFENMKTVSKNKGIPIDGIVIMFNDIAYGESLGKTSHHFKNGLAFKFYDEGGLAVIENVEYTIGKTGVLTPTAVFSPVELCGTTVTRASVHNISILKQLNIQIGDEVEVYKANEIIPQIRSNNTWHKDANAYKETIPGMCPYCGSLTRIATTRSNNKEVSVLKCTNDECCGMLLKKFSAFVSKSAMDIKGLSEKTLSKFIELGYLKTYSDIYTVCDKHKMELCSLPGFGERSVSQLIQAVENSRVITFDKLLSALNIDGVGANTAKTIADYYGDIKRFENSIESGKLFTELNSIYGLGDFVASSVSTYFNTQELYEEFKNLSKYLTIKTKEQKTKTNNVLNGMSFVITGSLETYKNRDALVETITSNGGTVDSSVKKTTTYLINNDVNSNSSKNKKAKELGVRIISEQDFNNLLGGNIPTTTNKKPTKLF